MTIADTIRRAGQKITLVRQQTDGTWVPVGIDRPAWLQPITDDVAMNYQARGLRSNRSAFLIGGFACKEGDCLLVKGVRMVIIGFVDTAGLGRMARVDVWDATYANEG